MVKSNISLYCLHISMNNKTTKQINRTSPTTFRSKNMKTKIIQFFELAVSVSVLAFILSAITFCITNL